MTPARRLADLIAAALLAPFVLPLMGLIALAILVMDGRPVLHVGERMRAPAHGFRFYKFRTMRPDPADSGVSGADKAARITRLGGFLRKSRLDELPQWINLAKGDITLVGPRPPLRAYVERFPDLYARVLCARPGITGLATTRFARHESWLLARSTSPEETDAIYSRACVPRKARLDLIHQANRGFCFDLAILVRTVIPVRRRPALTRARAG